LPTCSSVVGATVGCARNAPAEAIHNIAAIAEASGHTVDRMDVIAASYLKKNSLVLDP
jgi:hypothetical protein